MGCKLSIRVAVLMTALLSGTACSTVNAVKDTFFGGSSPEAAAERLTGFIGAVVADEPRAALAGREVLALGGSAADAAVVVGFSLAVTLPSRAGLGAQGACLAYDPKRDGPGSGSPEVILFTAPATPTPAGADRPAAVPMLARGLFALHARYGKRPFEGLLAGPEQMARFGVPVSRALVRDIAPLAALLAQDPSARAVFTPKGAALAEGGQLQQPELGATIAGFRTAGVGDLYQGALARKLEAASRIAGGPLTVDGMRGALPRTGGALTVQAGRDLVAFLPPPADGGLGAAAAFQALQNNPSDASGAQARAGGAVSRWRAGAGDPAAILASGGAGALPSSGAGTGFAVLDRDGNSVVCSVSMGNLFGTGRIAPGTGVLLGASPSAYGQPLLAAALAYNTNVRGFRAAVAGSGQEGAPLAVAVGMNNALRSTAALPAAVPEPGRANAIACARYLPDNDGSCTWAVDPRSSGLAAAGN